MRDLIDYTENYTNETFENIQVYYRKKKVLELINLQSHQVILEVGCGLDPLFNTFNDYDKLVILEPSDSFYNNACNLVNNSAFLKSKVDIYNGFLENSSNKLLNYGFDFILISCLLHEIEDTTAFLWELRKISRPGTILHIDVPNAFSFHRILANKIGLIKSVFELSENNKKFQQQRVFDLNSLKSLITSHGFEITRSGSFFIKPFTHKQMAEMVRLKIVDSSVLDGLYNMVESFPELGSEIYVEFRIHG